MVSLSRNSPTIRLYMPDADEVTLVVDGWFESQPMLRENNGYWSVESTHSIDDLLGHSYHFNVVENGRVFSVADPLAHLTKRDEKSIKSYFSDLRYDWKNSDFVTPPLHDIVIYETHLPALSRHRNTEVSHPSHRGRYPGATSPKVLRHLRQMNVCVEFLPLHASDRLLGQDWGYFTTSFHAMRESYALKEIDVNKEVMAVVDAMHGQGIPVILDVVFNHGAELWVLAWGKEIVYRKHENGDFCHGSGCGPTVNTEHPFIREMIIQTLQHLVQNYRFDGFRFDLGALHDKQTMLEIDRRLPKSIYLIAEPWALGGTLWGKGDMAHEFAHSRWAVWNDDFREPARTFLMGHGDHHNRDRLIQAITGNHIRNGGWAVRPQQRINYLTSHDGKSLADFVGNDRKRAFLGILMVLTSQGVPMLSEGSELMHSKQGHDNSYNRPDLNQIDWGKLRANQDLTTAVSRLILLRKTLPHFHYKKHLRYHYEKAVLWDICWIYPTGFPHRDNTNAIGFILKPPPVWYRIRRDRQSLIVLLNGSNSGADFHLPKGKWKVLVDGNSIQVNAGGIPDIPPAQVNYYLHPGTGVVLAQ
ncbi:MAG: hypothetical protein ABW076_17045 [Candidatus Thiodiazotropha sp.]